MPTPNSRKNSGAATLVWPFTRADLPVAVALMVTVTFGPLEAQQLSQNRPGSLSGNQMDVQGPAGTPQEREQHMFPPDAQNHTGFDPKSNDQTFTGLKEQVRRDAARVTALGILSRSVDFERIINNAAPCDEETDCSGYMNYGMPPTAGSADPAQ